MDQAVSRALKIMESLARSGGPVRLSRVSSETGVGKSTTHRILQTLVELGYATQEADTGRYGPTLKLWEMGSAVVMEHPVKRAASSFLQSLHKETGETVSLMVRSGDDVVYLEKLFSPRAVRFSTRPGSRAPAPLTAGGRAMLAGDPGARGVVDRLAARLDGRRAFDADAVMAEVAAAERRGYARSQNSLGAVSFGCGLVSKGGAPIAALSVSGPLERLDHARQTQVIDALISTCAQLAQTVGRL